MKLLKSNYFKYKDDSLYCEGVSAAELAAEFGTPLYVYSKNFFIDSYKRFDDAFKSVKHTIYYASKANYNINVIKTFYELGAGIDVNSAGEFYRAEKAGVHPARMLLTGVGKTKNEIKLGLEKGVHMIKAESFEEIERINEVAEKLGKIAPLAIRVNPDVDAQTHPYISTGLAENKFGVSSNDALKFFVEANKMKNLNVVGIDMHIGSQITQVSPYVDAVSKLGEIYKEIKSSGVPLQHFDIGGGMGIIYLDENPFLPEELAEKIIPILKPLECEVYFEPGRSLTANGGIMLTEVLYNKENNGKHFIVVDGSMTDILRPSIYKAYHHIQPVEMKSEESLTADVVGPVCESGDFLAKNREISKSDSGDILAVMSAGAYCSVMSSNYNGRRRAAEIIVDGENKYTARSRETYEHLLYDEKIIDALHR